MIRSLFALAVLGVTALAPFAIAEQKIIRIDLGKADSGAPAPSSSFRISKTPPDPTALVARGQWIYDLRYDRGDIFLVEVHRLELPAPQATPRAMGRFAVELFEANVLVERVRFDFPMLGAGLSEDGGALSFEKKLRTRIGVMFPVTSRGTRLELVDRATDKRWELPWPPGPAVPQTIASASPSASAASPSNQK